MKILLLGGKGQVGWEAQRAFAPLGEVVVLERQNADGHCGDLEQPEALAASVRALAPQLIVNAAAWTAVDKAESEAARAYAINATAVGALAEAAAGCGALLLHYSTDYVFDGSGEAPWSEDDLPAPLSEYGRGKLAGEEAIRASGCRHLILRTSWVYAARGGNFARTMLRLAAERERLAVVADQIGAPTGAELIADVSAHAARAVLADAALAGTYHLAAAGFTSWHGYASFVIEEARRLGAQLQVRHIDAIPTCDYPTPAARPLNSRLDTRRLCAHFGLQLPPWQQGVARMLAERWTSES